jgi:crossover junction endodeoxyribonuclease RusA
MVEIIVYGEPGAQGSKKFVGMAKGRGIMVEASKKVAPWRQDVKAACINAGKPHTPGPVRLEMVFTMPKPKSAPKRRRTWPSGRPDVSKLARSTEDALTQVGFYEDDARIVEYGRLAKVYPGEDPDALESPGVRIRIWPMDDSQIGEQLRLS